MEDFDHGGEHKATYSIIVIIVSKATMYYGLRILDLKFQNLENLNLKVFECWHNMSQMENSTKWWKGSIAYGCCMMLGVARSRFYPVQWASKPTAASTSWALKILLTTATTTTRFEWFFGWDWAGTQPTTWQLWYCCVKFVSAVITVKPVLISHSAYHMLCALSCKDISYHFIYISKNINMTPRLLIILYCHSDLFLNF